MNWGNIKWLVEQMTPAELERPALVFHSYYGRLYEIDALDNLRNLSRDHGDNNPVVLSLSREPQK